MSQKTTDQILLEAIQGLREDIARIDRDLEKDRENMEHIAMEFAGVKEKLDQFSKKMEHIQNKVADAVAPMMEQAENLTTAIEENQVVVVKNTPLYKRLLKVFQKGGK